MSSQRILVTGGGGYLGSQVIASLAPSLSAGGMECVVSLDVRETPVERRLPGVVYAAADIRDPSLAQLLRQHRIDTVVHLAAIVTPGRPSAVRRYFAHSEAWCSGTVSTRLPALSPLSTMALM